MRSDPSSPVLIPVDPESDSVCCDGGGGALGHPLVYYVFDGAPAVTCGYCDTVFIHAPKTAGTTGH